MIRHNEFNESQSSSDEFAQARAQMMEHDLRRRGIEDTRLLEAMASVPREEFVPLSFQDEAYADGPLPIGHGQTISQPFTVAYMIQALRLNGEEKVLEIGTGSGYAAAVLSRLVRVVHTVERIPELGERAKIRLLRLGFSNVQVHIANGTLGLPDEAPFDAIVVTAGAEELPVPYAQQLVDGGRIVIPLGLSFQRMYRFTRCGDELEAEDLGGFSFVPLIGKYGLHEPIVW